MKRSRLIAIASVVPAIAVLPAGSAAAAPTAAAGGNATWRVNFQFRGTVDNVVASSKTAAWAYGVTGNRWRIVRWNGHDWQTMRTLRRGLAIDSIAASGPSDVWVFANTRTSQEALRWDGQAWHAMPVPDGGIGQIVVLGPDNVWGISESFFSSAAGWQTVLAHWNGARWTSTTLKNRAENLAGSAGTGLWLVGMKTSSLNVSDPRGTLLAYRWDGHAWRLAAMPHPKIVRDPEIARGADGSVWIYARPGHGRSFVLRRRRNGSWQRITAPERGKGSLGAIAAVRNRFWLNGDFIWDGRRWLRDSPQIVTGGVAAIPGTESAWLVRSPFTVVIGGQGGIKPGHTAIYLNGTRP